LDSWAPVPFSGIGLIVWEEALTLKFKKLKSSSWKIPLDMQRQESE